MRVQGKCSKGGYLDTKIGGTALVWLNPAAQMTLHLLHLLHREGTLDPRCRASYVYLGDKGRQNRVWSFAMELRLSRSTDVEFVSVGPTSPELVSAISTPSSIRLSCRGSVSAAISR